MFGYVHCVPDSGEGAEQALQAGAAGIIVSNLGGRALDTVPATVNICS